VVVSNITGFAFMCHNKLVKIFVEACYKRDCR